MRSSRFPAASAFSLVVLPIHAEVDISTLANLINAIAVTAGVIFAATQIRYYRQRRRRDAMLELVRSFQSPAFTSALRRVLSLPDGADAQKIREVLGPDGEDAVYLVALTWESIGVLLFRRELTLDTIDETLAVPSLYPGVSVGFIPLHGVRRWTENHSTTCSP